MVANGQVVVDDGQHTGPGGEVLEEKLDWSND